MNSMKCQCCFKLLAKASVFEKLEIKCPRCKTINTFQSASSALPECPEHPTQSGKIHDTKPLTTIQS
ncbi:Com family DNA-binding transcriptional regulator [Acinetobacter ursingii]|uniref:Com family DNA-binding transcriptional regulator n=2 Tax=Acinetobacter ursingii TaxID=108980 RepID=UPI00387EC3D0